MEAEPPRILIGVVFNMLTDEKGPISIVAGSGLYCVKKKVS